MLIKDNIEAVKDVFNSNVEIILRISNMFTSIIPEFSLDNDTVKKIYIPTFDIEKIDVLSIVCNEINDQYHKEIPSMVPAPTRAHLATPCGLLFNELVKSPQNVLLAFEKLLDLVLEHDTGRYSETSSPVILYIVRIIIVLEGYVLYLLDQDRAREIRGLACTPHTLKILR